MRIHSLDSVRRLRTKKIRSIDLTVAGVTAAATTLLFRPNVGHKFIVTGVTSHVRSALGTITDAPNILLDNGTDASNFVAGVDLATTTGSVKQHTIATTTLFTDHDHPIRLKSVDGADGSTTFLVDIVLQLVEITGE